nr:glycerol kinase [Porphyrobacter sp. GA68]
MVLDAGTTSTRAILYDAAGLRLGLAQEEITQHYPRPGWVEHDAAEIWERTLRCMRRVAAQASGVHRIGCIGITNQRETVVAWDRKSGEPLARAIVWQDRRTEPQCAALRETGHEEKLQRRTGLVLDPYFSATKMRWLLEHKPAVAAAARSGRLAFGTVESWLLFKLSGGAFLTDASNASRTLLLPLDGAQFADDLCGMFDVPRSALAEVVDSAGVLARTDSALLGTAIPVTGMAGDQQAATIGQGCLAAGDTKATFGTGAFVLTNQGADVPHSRHRLLGTVLYQLAGSRTYALEGAVFVAGSLVQWLRDALGVIASASETEALARSVEDSGGVVVVPALAGLGAPHWRPDATAVISGLTFASGRAHLARAALESMAHQTHDLAEAFAADGARWARLRIDGGMSANDWLAQDISDILRLPVERPEDVETTARGAAMLAAAGAGIYPSLKAAADAMLAPAVRFNPLLSAAARDRRLSDWRAALNAALAQ